MPIQLQCTSVVIRNDALDRVLDGGSEDFGSIAPNAMSYSDDSLSQASFMSPVDAEEFARSLELRGLTREIESPDFVVVTAHDREVIPSCEWLILFEYEQRLIATLRGSESRTVIAPAVDEKYDPNSVQHYSAEEIAERFEFVKRNGAIDTYRDKATGELVYHARHTESPDEIFRRAFDVIWELRREPGGPVRQGKEAESIQAAIAELQPLAAKHPDVFKVPLALGIGWFSVGKEETAIRHLDRAHELEPENTIVLKELGGVYLNSGDFESAVKTTTKAVAVNPDDAELLGNLAVSQLLARRIDEAKSTISYAITLDANDSINQNLKHLVDQVARRKRPQPTSLRELMTPHKPKSMMSKWFGFGRSTKSS